MKTKISIFTLHLDDSTSSARIKHEIEILLYLFTVLHNQPVVGL